MMFGNSVVMVLMHSALSVTILPTLLSTALPFAATDLPTISITLFGSDTATILSAHFLPIHSGSFGSGHLLLLLLLLLLPLPLSLPSASAPSFLSPSAPSFLSSAPLASFLSSFLSSFLASFLPPTLIRLIPLFIILYTILS